MRYKQLSEKELKFEENKRVMATEYLFDLRFHAGRQDKLGRDFLVGELEALETEAITQGISSEKLSAKCIELLKTYSEIGSFIIAEELKKRSEDILRPYLNSVSQYSNLPSCYLDEKFLESVKLHFPNWRN